MSEQEQIQRGEHAKRLLDDPLFQEAMRETRQAVVDTWVALPVENKVQAEELKRMLWAVDQFEAIFVTLIGGATVARHELLMQANMEIKAEAVKRRINGT